MTPDPVPLALMAASAVGLIFHGITRRRRPLDELLDDYNEHVAGRAGAATSAEPNRRSLGQLAEHHAQRAGWPLQAGELAAIWVGATVLLTATAWVGVGNIFAALALGALLALGGLYMAAQAAAIARLRKLEAQLGPALAIVGGLLKARTSLPQALEEVANQTPAPLGTELEWVVRRHTVGGDLIDTLGEVAERVDSDEFRFFVVSADYTRQTGGDLADIVDSLVDTLSDRLKLRGDLKTQLAEAQLTKYALSAAPGALLAFLTVISPDHLDPLVNTTYGRWFLIAAIILWAAGIIWCTAIVNRVRI